MGEPGSILYFNCPECGGHVEQCLCDSDAAIRKRIDVADRRDPDWRDAYLADVVNQRD